MKLSAFVILGSLAGAAMVSTVPAVARDRWTATQASTWNDKQPWLLGSNYLPSDAINELEMWQQATFDPARIDQEFSWAQALGMNCMRVFLHDALWRQDAEGFKQRMNEFLAIAARHKIKIMFVLFDSCWDPDPHLGPQHPPIPGVHNSGWVQAPGGKILDDPGQYAELKAYVTGVVGAFAHDDRILAWDVWNEPDNLGGGDYSNNPKDKVERVAALLPQVFDWASSADPIQPLTSSVWQDDDWSPSAPLNSVEKTQLSRSDIISFHEYSWPEKFEGRVKQLSAYDRPILCTEYMARAVGSTFDTIAPIGKRHNIGMINWGFVAGKSQTYLPWDSWNRPYTLQPPAVWFHDILHDDGRPYREREAQILRELTAAPKGVVPNQF